MEKVARCQLVRHEGGADGTECQVACWGREVGGRECGEVTPRSAEPLWLSKLEAMVY